MEKSKAKYRVKSGSDHPKAWILKVEEFQPTNSDKQKKRKVSEKRCSSAQTDFQIPAQNESNPILSTNWLLSHIDIHGLNTWLETNQFIAKMCWGVVIFSAFLALCYGLYKSTHDYYNNPILTTYSIVPERKMEFPDIYICPTNFINQSYVLENKTDLSWARYYWVRMSNGSGEVLNEKTTVWESIIGLPDPGNPEPQSKEPKNFQDFIMSLGYSTEKFLVECKFANQQLDCTNITEPVFDKDHGRCFLIRRNFSQSVAGIGLSLIFNIHTHEYPWLTYRNPPMFDGVYLSISKQFSPASFDKILIGPGALTKISLMATKIMLINVKSQPCVEKDDPRGKFEILNVDYSNEACRMECVQKVAAETCNCLLAMDKKFLKTANFSVCHPEIMKDCVTKSVTYKKKSEISSCSEKCYPACESWHYKADISSLKFPSRTLEQRKSGRMKKHIERWQYDYVLVDIAFKNLHRTEIVQAASMTFETFISNLGGQMGIWLGASLLTGVQAFMLTVCFCIGKFQSHEN